MRSLKHISAFILSAAMVMSMGITASARELTVIDKRLCLSDNGENTLYTGWTTVNGLHRYYKDGKRCLGWRKINGSYYYLTKNGGRAARIYQIGDTVYEFGEDGKYIGLAVSGNDKADIYKKASNSGFGRIRGYVMNKMDSDGNVIFPADFGGIEEGGDTCRLYLTNTKNADVYRDLYGDCTFRELEIIETNISYSELTKLRDYLRENWDEWDENNNEFYIKGFAIIDNNVVIEVKTDEEAERFHDYLIKQGFSDEMFYIHVSNYEFVLTRDGDGAVRLAAAEVKDDK